MSLTLKPELLEKYNIPGPTYTSYPATSMFREDFSAKDSIRHITNSNGALLPRPLALYIHLPCCQALCADHGYNNLATPQQEKVQVYLDYLYREIELLAPYLAQDRLVTQIHFSGDTFNYLSSLQFREIMEIIARRFHLSFPEALDISLEADPRYCHSEHLAELAAMGINRISISAQHDHHEAQIANNAAQYQEQVDTFINNARSQGIHAVSIELTAGLPPSFTTLLQQGVASGVDRIALYNLTCLPRYIRSQQLTAASDLPEPATRQAIARHTLNTLNLLSENGYVHLGMDHFVLPTDPLAKALAAQQLRLGFRGYTTDSDCDQLGLGASAISQIGDAYSQNARALPAYYARLDSRQLPVQRGISLDKDDLIRAHIIQCILCQHPVNYKMLDARFNIDCKRYFSRELEQLQVFAEDELVALTDSQFTITPPGHWFLRHIARVFDRYLVAGVTKNSHTV